MTQERIYTLTEAAKLLHYCKETTRQLVKGRPEVYRIRKAGHYRIPAATVEQIRRELQAINQG